MLGAIESVLFIIYLIAGYWAVGQTIYRNKVLIGTMTNIVGIKFLLGAVFGWILIPVALILNALDK